MTTRITKSELNEMVRESVASVIKEQSQVGLRTSLAKVIKYLMKRQSSAIDQSEFYEIETHLKTMKKLAEALGE